MNELRFPDERAAPVHVVFQDQTPEVHPGNRADREACRDTMNELRGGIEGQREGVLPPVDQVLLRDLRSLLHSPRRLGVLRQPTAKPLMNACPKRQKHVADQQAARQKVGLAQDKKYILFPWDPDRKIKRADIANEALTILQKNHPTAELMCLHNVSHETVADYMNACDAMVLVSDAEGAPVAVREALACNLPVVSVDVGDVKQLLEGVEECYQCEQHPQDVAAKLDIVLRSGRRSNGREKLSQMDNNWSAQQVLLVYQSMMPDGNPKA